MGFKAYLTETDKERIEQNCAVVSNTAKHTIPFFLSLFTVGAFLNDKLQSMTMRIVGFAVSYVVFFLIIKLIVLLVKAKRELTARAAVRQMDDFVVECTSHISEFHLPDQTPNDKIALRSEIAYAYVGLFSVYFQFTYLELPYFRRRESNVFYKKKGNKNPLFYLTIVYLLCNAARIANADDRTVAEKRYTFYVEACVNANTYDRIGYENESEKVFRSGADHVPETILSALQSHPQDKKAFEHYILTQFYGLYPKFKGWEWKI